MPRIFVTVYAAFLSLAVAASPSGAQTPTDPPALAREIREEILRRIEDDHLEEVVVSVDQREHLLEMSVSAMIEALGLSPDTEYYSRQRIAEPATSAPPLSVESDTLEGAGHLRISQFTERTKGEVESVLAGWSTTPEQVSGGVVLDLRGNPGGLLSAAIEVADLFIDHGRIATIANRDPREIERFDAQDGDRLHGLTVVVLIDGSTARGAELVAAAMQDNDRATIMGEPSLGSGLIQTIVPLRGGRDGALILPTGQVFRPNSEPITGAGVTPDVITPVGDGEDDIELDRAFEFLRQRL